MRRRRFVGLALAPTLLVGAALAAFVVVDARALADDVAAADAAASAYGEQVEAYRGAVAGGLGDADPLDADAVSDVLEDNADALPELGRAPARGESDSPRYQAALREAADLDRATSRLGDVLESTRGSGAFVEAATAALSLDPGTLAPGGAVADGGPLRQGLLPTMRGTLATFEGARAPEAADPVRRSVVAALQHVIDEGERVAATLDAGSSASFTYAEEYEAARQAVRDYDAGVRADLQEAVDAVVTDPTVSGLPVSRVSTVYLGPKVNGDPEDGRLSARPAAWARARCPPP